MSTILPLRLAGIEVRRAGRTILGPLDLDVEDSGPLVVLGPNGAGKSTLLRVCHGITHPTKGKADWVVPRAEANLAQAFVFQTPILLRRSALENVMYPLSLRGEGKKAARATAQKMLDDVGLADLATVRASVLSGGEKQKLALARALVTRPEVLFLDEPTASLDGRSTREIETILAGAQSGGTKLMMATHDLGQARRIAAHVVFLLNGQIIETRSAKEFFEGPSTAAAQAFLKGDIVE
ncbi:MAG: amino acid ABC transporter ATP-binding protein [Boseongicola sp.]|nr:ATP-binding cassette domain-containing protein [Boseongicola sp.]NNL19378.1 amino acid ABC transporter ATP-binding protein [Boseongicola sp.]